MNGQWSDLLYRIINDGQEVCPRGKVTKEIPQATIEVNMRCPVLTDKRRKLSYTGMAAEAYWILTGDSSLAGIELYLPRMKDFSDDGVTLAGAYGPRLHEQLSYVLEQLRADPDTRQATLTLWNRNPAPSKDKPCTVAFDFKIRDAFNVKRERKLNLHVFMRSSDAWLGIPYDVFSFSMVAHLICAYLNNPTEAGESHDVKLLERVSPGTLYLTAASSHLYEENWLAAVRCLNQVEDVSQYPTPEALWTSPQRLLFRLDHLRKSARGDKLRWWESGQ